MGGADAVGAQHDLVEGVAAATVTWTARRRRGWRGRGPRRDWSIVGVVRRRGHEDGRLGPARGAEVGRRGRPGNVDLLDLQAGRLGADGGRDARGADDTDHPGAVGSDSGRDRRALRAESAPRPHGRARRGPADRVVGQAAGGLGDGDSRLAPKAPPLARGVAGSPPGSHHDASGSR